MQKYINVNPESGKKFYQDYHNKGKIVMLNLLKFRQKADYTNFEQIKPIEEVTGEEAYQLYMKNILPEFKNAGSRIIYFGKSIDFLIGPEPEKWDAVLIVEYESLMKFMEFSAS